MSVADLLAAGRAAHAELLVDTCTVTRRSGTRTWQQATGTYLEGTVAVYAGACRVKPWVGDAGDQDVAEQQATVTRVTVDLPWGSAAVQRGDTVTVTSSNAWLTGRALVVTAVELSTTATAQRLVAQAVQAST